MILKRGSIPVTVAMCCLIVLLDTENYGGP